MCGSSVTEYNFGFWPYSGLQVFPKHILLLALITLATAACTTNPPITDTFTGPVTKVHDGDSIHIMPKGEKRIIIRLAGIDAPEIKQPFGIASRDKLRSIILNRTAKAKCHKVCLLYTSPSPRD